MHRQNMQENESLRIKVPVLLKTWTVFTCIVCVCLKTDKRELLTFSTSVLTFILSCWCSLERKCFIHVMSKGKGYRGTLIVYFCQGNKVVVLACHIHAFRLASTQASITRSKPEFLFSRLLSLFHIFSQSKTRASIRIESDIVLLRSEWMFLMTFQCIVFAIYTWKIGYGSISARNSISSKSDVGICK